MSRSMSAMASVLRALGDRPGSTVGGVTVATEEPPEVIRRCLRRLCELGLARGRIEQAGAVYRLVNPNTTMRDVSDAENAVERATRSRTKA